MKKILVLGKGFVSDHLNYDKYTDHINPDVNQINQILQKYNPDVVINCLGRTGGSQTIDWCESNQESTIESNLTLPVMLASECNKQGVKFIHIGSGCIYYGESPNSVIKTYGNRRDASFYSVDTGWQETDFARPESFYSQIKYACDLAISRLPNTAILRIRMPISWKDSPRNLINKLIKYENVLEEPNSVTFLDDLARAIDWVIENNKSGIYHVTNPDSMTHIQLLEEYKKYYPEHKYNKINKEELKQFTKAPRSNCIIDSSKIQNEGFVFSDTKEALVKTIERYCNEKI